MSLAIMYFRDCTLLASSHCAVFENSGRLLTPSGLTHPEVSKLVFPGSFCLSACSFGIEYIYGFVGWGSVGKVDDVIPSRAVQDGGYALPWQRYDNNKMAAICYSTSSTVQA